MDIHDRVNQRLKLRDLRLLLTVAELGSMAKAAARLNLTQSGVSRAIADMEHTLGVRLFDRTAQGVAPTLYGGALRKWGNAVFDDIRQAVNEIAFLADPTVGELRIGCSEPMLAGLLPVVLQQLYGRYPRVHFHVTQLTTTPQQYHELRQHNVDLLLGRMLQPLDDDLDAAILFGERTFVVAGPQNPWGRRRKITFSELIDGPWCLPTSDAVIGALFEDAVRRLGLPLPRLSVTTTSIQLHAAMLHSGPFLSLFPGSLLRFAGKRLALKILPVDVPIKPWPVGIVTLKNRTTSPLTQVFIDCAHAVAKPLAKSNG
jgi:DNA-binding transcriptional LysR family regulator